MPKLVISNQPIRLWKSTTLSCLLSDILLSDILLSDILRVQHPLPCARTLPKTTQSIVSCSSSIPPLLIPTANQAP